MFFRPWQSNLMLSLEKLYFFVFCIRSINQYSILALIYYFLFNYIDRIYFRPKQSSFDVSLEKLNIMTFLLLLKK